MSATVANEQARSSLEERLRLLEQENAHLAAELEQCQRLHQDLLQSEEKFRGAVENASVGMALVMPDGTFVDCNEAYCQLVGYPMEELRRMRFSDLVHDDDRDANLKLNERLLAGELSSFVVRNRYVRKDGQVVWVRKSIARVLDEGGNPKWFSAIVEDLTQNIQAEQEQRKSERIYRAIGESIPYGVWINDLDGQNTYASPSLLGLLGMTQEQFSGFGWGDALDPNDVQRISAAWKDYIRDPGDRIWSTEHRFRGKDGQYYVQLLVSGIGRKGL